jgi:hypothetical protein
MLYFSKKRVKTSLFRSVGLTANDILGGLEVSGENAPQGDYDIVLFPLEDETLTDEDSDDEDEDQATENPNHLGKGILSQQAELMVMDNDELPDLTVVNSEGEIIKVVEDETAAGGLQQPPCCPVRTRAHATVREDEGMEEDEEDKDE